MFIPKLGSSPRMRGTHVRVLHADAGQGIIPAYAGNTCRPAMVGGHPRDHPRVCGEHTVNVLVAVYVSGIIPAYAGNTRISQSQGMTTRDHPRVCGEHMLQTQSFKYCLGSSPRMRGTRVANTYQKSLFGDHPRVCGEHEMPMRQNLLHRGSSPRMRGTHLARAVRFVGGEIIPAYAGNTSQSTPPGTAIRDHPRVCGEHPCPKVKHAHDVGSSPRMRGTLFAKFSGVHTVGIIPAYAGNTRGLRSLLSSARDHPRVCGEHMGLATNTGSSVGSSPRMRGTRLSPTPITSMSGIIPAYAGNTPRNLARCLVQGDHHRVCGEHAVTILWPAPSAGSSPRMRGTQV